MWQYQVGFFGNTLDIVKFSPSVRVSNAFWIEVQYDLSYGRFDAGKYLDAKGSFPHREGRFTDHVLDSRLNYNSNNQWLTSTTIQYNNTESFVGLNFRLNYIYRPDDDFFFYLQPRPPRGRSAQWTTRPQRRVQPYIFVRFLSRRVRFSVRRSSVGRRLPRFIRRAWDLQQLRF